MVRSESREIIEQFEEFIDKFNSKVKNYVDNGGDVRRFNSNLLSISYGFIIDGDSCRLKGIKDSSGYENEWIHKVRYRKDIYLTWDGSFLRKAEKLMEEIVSSQGTILHDLDRYLR